MTHSATITAVRRTRIFIASQVLLVVAVAIVPVVWANRTTPRFALPLLDLVATEVQPTCDEPLVVTDEQLTSVLSKLRPRFRVSKPKINHVDHALRFWGIDATFSDPACLSGDEMRALLVDHGQFVKVWGDDTKPLMARRGGGVAVRVQHGASTSSHVDHTLGTLAEVGTPLDFPVSTADGPARLRDVLNYALATFDINQQEYEWTTLVLALYAIDGSPWHSADGQQIDFDRLADRLMRQRLQLGVCYGNHRLYTLALLLRLDDQKHLLSSGGRERVFEHLRAATQRLIASQDRTGFWDQNWPNATLPAEDSILDGALPRRLLATGHTLEWWAMAPSELHPPREVIVRAGQWLVREIQNLDVAAIDKHYTFLTHAGRALTLWRGKLPADWIRAHALPDPALPADTTIPPQGILPESPALPPPAGELSGSATVGRSARSHSGGPV